MAHFVFTTNSPGEVATWLTPTVRELRRRAPDAKLSVFIVPCAFATGTETDVVRTLPQVDEAYGPGDYWRIALGGTLPTSLAELARAGQRSSSAQRGALLYLGGDLMHAARLARRLHLPPLAYVERGSRWTKSFVELLVPDEEARERVVRQGETESRVRIVGNLMVDAVRPSAGAEAGAARFGIDPQRPVVAVFPGSRSYEIKLTLPFLMRALELVQRGLPGIQTLISLSAFADPSVLQGRAVAELEGVSLHVREAPERGGWAVTTDGGLSALAVQGAPYDIMQVADLAVTLPGSNTAEMAAAGLPMVVALPLNLAEQIPLPGAAQYVEKLPLVGKHLKRYFVRRRAAQMQYVAWPNRKTRTALVPEVRGDLVPDEVARTVLDLLRDVDRRTQMAEVLRQTLGASGAAARVAERMLAAAGTTATAPSPSDQGGATT